MIRSNLSIVLPQLTPLRDTVGHQTLGTFNECSTKMKHSDRLGQNYVSKKGMGLIGDSKHIICPIIPTGVM